MSYTGHTTTTLAKWIPEVWAAYIEPAAVPRLVLDGAVVQWPFSGPGGTLDIPKMADIGACANLPTAGSEIDTEANTENYVQVTPVGRYKAIFVPVQIAAAAVAATETEYQAALGRKVRTDREYRILTNVASLTTHIINAGSGHADKAEITKAKGKLLGSDAEGPFRGVFHTDEYEYFYAIDKFVDASVIGGNRMESGDVGRVLGVDFYFTSNVYTDATYNYNVIMDQRCLVHAIKFDVAVTIDVIPTRAHGLQIMAKYMDGSGILNDDFGCAYVTNVA